jgi:hypothetical protein
MWRFNDQAQPSAYAAADITVIDGCPVPEVVSAVALSDTSVKVTFSRRIAPASVTGDGSQFTITGGAGLTVSAAVVAGREVTLTTSAHVGDEVYTVTVANTVTDTLGTALSDVNNTAMFNGFVVLASVVINEVKANITPGCDLIELRVISGGSMTGFELWERATTLVTFAGLTVATGDLVVVHDDSGDASCNPTASGNETVAIDELPSATHSQNYDSAWDWYSSDAGLTASTNVFTLYDTGGAIMDALFATANPADDMVAAGTETRAAVVAAAGQWTMVGGGVPGGGFVDLDFSMHAVDGLGSGGTSIAGDSLQRLAGDDVNTMTDWVLAPPTWGALNCPAAAPTGGGDLVFETVDTVAGEVTIRNKGAGSIDIGAAGWNLCASFTYATPSSVTLVSGNLNLGPGEAVTLGWASIADVDTDLGLYDSAVFTDAASMKAFAQWGASGLGRESVADTAGLWTAGDFIDLAGTDGFIATGDVAMSAGYTRAEAACIP